MYQIRGSTENFNFVFVYLEWLEWKIIQYNCKIRWNRQQKKRQLVLQHCCKTSWIAMRLRVLSLILIILPCNNVNRLKAGGKTRNVVFNFNSFCNSVARQIALLCCLFYRSLWQIKNCQMLHQGKIRVLHQYFCKQKRTSSKVPAKFTYTYIYTSASFTIACFCWYMPF